MQFGIIDNCLMKIKIDITINMNINLIYYIKLA